MTESINNYFTACTRNLTPASAGHAACVMYAPVSLDPDVSRMCASVLSPAELIRAECFVSPFDKAGFEQRRAFRRFCAATATGALRSLSRLDFEEAEKGLPHLSAAPGIQFSFSSCRLGFLGAWSSTHGVGVDLEDPSRNLQAEELAHHYFSEAEALTIKKADKPERQQVFFRFWSLKEAALKSIGEGLPYGLDAFEFDLSPRLRVVHAPPDHGGAGQFNAHVIEGTGGCAALVIRNLAR